MNAPRRRWFRFSLRTLFVVVTLIAVYLGWAMNWKRQRNEFVLGTREIFSGHYFSGRSKRIVAGRGADAPVLLRPVGAKGYDFIFVPREAEAELDRARRLFPEADIVRPWLPIEPDPPEPTP